MNKYKQRAMKRLFGDASKNKVTDAFLPSRIVLDKLVEAARRVDDMLSGFNDLKKLSSLIKRTHDNIIKIKETEEPSKGREVKISKEFEKLQNSPLYREFDLGSYI